MDAPLLTAEQIRAQMREIRRDLPADVKGIVTHATQMFDWKNYVRSFPWGSVAAAALIGYLIVPRRVYTAKLNREDLDHLLTEHRLKIVPQAASRPPANLWTTFVPVVGSLALRMGLSYAAKLGAGLLDELTTDRQTGGHVQPAMKSKAPTPSG